MAATTEEIKDQPLFDVKLLKPHTHKGDKKKAGDTIKVTEYEQQWLIDQAIIAGKTS